MWYFKVHSTKHSSLWCFIHLGPYIARDDTKENKSNPWWRSITDKPMDGDREPLFAWALRLDLLLHLKAPRGIWAHKKSLFMSEMSVSLSPHCMSSQFGRESEKKEETAARVRRPISEDAAVRWLSHSEMINEETAPSTGSKISGKSGRASRRCTRPQCWQFHGKDSCRRNTEGKHS